MMKFSAATLALISDSSVRSCDPFYDVIIWHHLPYLASAVSLATFSYYGVHIMWSWGQWHDMQSFYITSSWNWKKLSTNTKTETNFLLILKLKTHTKTITKSKLKYNTKTTLITSLKYKMKWACLVRQSDTKAMMGVHKQWTDNWNGGIVEWIAFVLVFIFVM